MTTEHDSQNRNIQSLQSMSLYTRVPWEKTSLGQYRSAPRSINLIACITNEKDNLIRPNEGKANALDFHIMKSPIRKSIQKSDQLTNYSVDRYFLLQPKATSVSRFFSNKMLDWNLALIQYLDRDLHKNVSFSTCKGSLQKAKNLHASYIASRQ